MSFTPLDVGVTRGRWTLVAQEKTPEGRTVWLCRCSCGTLRQVRADRLNSGTSHSCGCASRETHQNFINGALRRKNK